MVVSLQISHWTATTGGGGGGESSENRPLRICKRVEAVLSSESKPNAKHNGELEADRVCQGDLICLRTEIVARAPFLIGVDSRAGSSEGWSYSFQPGLW